MLLPVCRTHTYSTICAVANVVDVLLIGWGGVMVTLGTATLVGFVEWVHVL